MTGTDLIQRATLEALLGHRDRTFALATEARAQHRVTLDKVAEARGAASLAAPGDYTLHKLFDHILDKYDDDQKFMGKGRADLDRSIWRHVLAHTGLGGMMDKQAMREFEAGLQSDPPECTADNIRATFQHLRENAYRIFRRGLVKAFTNLSREYRSHDGFKLGPRTVIAYGVRSNHYDYDTFADIDRMFQILDGKRIGEGWYSELGNRLRDEVKTEFRMSRSGGSGTFVVIPGEFTTPIWRIRWFQNQNVHLWCLRPDLLRRANRVIAEHFANELGAGPDVAGARRYTRARPHHHDVEDFFPTPPGVAEAMVRAAGLRPGMDVLEPSAGEGAIVQAILAAGITPDAVENHPDRADILRDMLPYGAVIEMDFLRMAPPDEPEYDAVIANPPFGRGAGVQHIHHALRFLKPGGRLVAILGAGLDYREDGPTVELRRLIAAWGRTERLPPGSFKEAGTMTDAVVLIMDKPGRSVPALEAPEPQASFALAAE